MLVERDGLLDALLMQIEAARSGTGSLALVAGEAGAGKTSLVRALTASLDNSVVVLEGACDPLTTPRPLSPLHDFAASPDADLAELMTSDLTTFEMFELVLDRIRTPARPVTMIIEDLHWADDATLDFLRFVGRRIADTKAVAICTYRDDEVGADHPLRPVLGQLAPLRSTRRHLVPALSLDAVSTLARGTGRDPAELLQVTGGNAFFVTEILESDADVPDTVQSAVLARVARLPASSRRVVEAVSVAPRALDVEHAAVLVDATIDDIDTTLAAGALVGDGRTLRFRHELARSAVEASLPPARRLDLHRRMLGLIADDPEPDLARLAHHAIRSGASAEIVEYAPAAGSDASARGAHREAIAFFEAAVAELDRLGDTATAATIRCELAKELAVVDDSRRGVVELDRALEHLRTAGPAPVLGRALLQLTVFCWRTRDTARGEAVLAEALALPGGPDMTAIKTEAHLSSAQQLMLARHREAAREALAAAYEAAGDDVTPAQAWKLRMIEGTIEMVVGDAAQGVRLLRESCDAAVAAGDPDQMSVALNMLGSGGGEARVYAEAINALEDCIEIGLKYDQDYTVAYARSWLARIALEQGRWDDAVDHAELVAGGTDPAGISYLTAMTALGRVRVRRGDPGGAALLDELTELAATHEIQHGWNAVCGRAEHHWLAGTPERALDALAATYRRTMDTDSEWARGEVGFWMWRLGAIDGPPPGAAAPFALQMIGDWRAAADAWREIGCPYEVATALADGDTDARLEALEIFDALGAAPAARALRDRLQQAGVARIPRGPQRSTRSNPAGLTDRQLDVLRLLAAGRSNPEIAAELIVSKKTVEHHVSAIYDKLGVRSRTAAVVEASKIGALPT